ncbi:MAG: hypothetical protein H0V14_02510 [Chitinophagaceae bacterium]|nr:hypothetical protein [Chitinophagaceae bacterium]
MADIEEKTEERKIGLFINPLAGKGRSTTLALQISNKLKEKSIDCHVFESVWPATLHQLYEVWIVGGDGTLHYFLNKYKHIDIPLAIFKGGTGNDFAWKLYGEMTVEQQIQHLFSVSPKAVDAAESNGIIFINGIGIGFDGEVIRSIKTIRWIGGHLGYYLAIIKQIFFYKELLLTIKVNNNIFTGKYLLTMICNSSRMGGGFMISPESLIDDGILNVILCKPLTLFKRLRYLPVIEKGRHLHLPFINSLLNVSNIKVSATKKVYAQIGGDLYCDDVFNIAVLPKKYLFRY